MNQIEIGKYIAECRKEKKLTQAQLAEKLNITDRAVSKWETGKSMPDSSIMLPLCEILGISANELLSGKAVAAQDCEEKTEEHLIVRKRKEEKKQNKKRTIGSLYSGILLTGILVCLICNLAISGRITWAWIPVSSIALAWVISFPVFLLGKRGLLLGLQSLSIFIIPYLFLLSRLTETKEVFSIGTAASVIFLLFLWSAVAVFQRMGTERKGIAFGITFLSAILCLLITNGMLSKMIAEPFLDQWDVLVIFFLLAAALFSFTRAMVR